MLFKTIYQKACSVGIKLWVRNKLDKLYVWTGEDVIVRYKVKDEFLSVLDYNCTVLSTYNHPITEKQIKEEAVLRLMDFIKDKIIVKKSFRNSDEIYIAYICTLYLFEEVNKL